MGPGLTPMAVLPPGPLSRSRWRPRSWHPGGRGPPTHLAMVSTPSFTRSRSLLNVWIFMMEAATGSVEKCWEEGGKLSQKASTSGPGGHASQAARSQHSGGSSDTGDNSKNCLTAGPSMGPKQTQQQKKEEESPFDDSSLGPQPCPHV